MTEKPLKYQAYALIRQKIINCEYAPGAFITENLLQETVPGSRTPVRDAIGRLEQENLVTIFPKKGILVAPVLPKDISSLFQLRMMWEPYAVQKYGNMLSCDFYMSFYDHFFSADLRDNRQHYEKDDEFHTAFIQATNNPYILRVYEQIHVHLHRSRVWVGNTDAVRLEASQEEHQRILLACIKKDWDLAAEMMQEHLACSRMSTLTELAMKMK
ncbi:MAG: GntR family transcriptional regulator [Lachnospiraceae bacterium]|jgi:Transcriptional regulators|nr:GntR family transcriptional regulator [Lachnospiraceae bacterium]MCI9657655.1 GntR family transcriptional regulator [Lachnospiraceae bacterium]